MNFDIVIKVNGQRTVEIVEFYDRKIPIYEIMLSQEFDKKMLGAEYEVLIRSDFIPFVEWGSTEDWRALKSRMSYEEFLDKFPNAKRKK